MEYNIDFENSDSKENIKICKIFGKQIKLNANLLDTYDDYESFIQDCIKNTFIVCQIQKYLGKSKKFKENQVDTCTLCDNVMKKNELYRTLKCNHTFHKKCLDKFVSRYHSNYCPCCNEEIM